MGPDSIRLSYVRFFPPVWEFGTRAGPETLPGGPDKEWPKRAVGQAGRGGAKLGGRQGIDSRREQFLPKYQEIHIPPLNRSQLLPSYCFSCLIY